MALRWGAVVFLRGGLVLGCLAGLITASVFSRPFFHLETDPVPLTVDRVLWVALMVQYVVWRRMGRAGDRAMRSTITSNPALVAICANSSAAKR